MKTAFILIVCIVAAGSVLAADLANNAQRRRLRRRKRGKAEGKGIATEMLLRQRKRGKAEGKGIVTEMLMTMSMPTTNEAPSEIGNACTTGSWSWSTPCESPENYCAADAGSCQKGEIAGTCRAKPMGCTRDYWPVCGCDGRTYGNECVARHEGVNVAHEGECEEGRGCGALDPCGDAYFCMMSEGACAGPAAAQTGTCGSRGGRGRQVVCPMVWAPVCGCDGKVYSNSCMAGGAEVNVARRLDGLVERYLPGDKCSIEMV